jgi:hypothetical protein
MYIAASMSLRESMLPGVGEQAICENGKAGEESDGELVLKHSGSWKKEEDHDLAGENWAVGGRMSAMRSLNVPAGTVDAKLV